MPVQNVSIRLDDYEVPQEEFSISSFSLTDRNDNQRPFTSDIDFTGMAAQIIKDRLININQSKITELDLIIRYDDEVQINATVTGKGITLLDGECAFKENQCQIRVKAIEKKGRLDLFKESIISDGIEQDGHPLIQMNLEVSAIEDLLVNIAQAVIFLLSLSLIPAIFIIVTVINAIISAINVLPGVRINKIDLDGDDSTGTFEELKSLRQQLFNEFDQIHVYPSPFIRSYILNVLRQVEERTGESYTFVSSIFNDPSSDYYNACYWYAPNTEGHTNGSTTLINRNDPIITCGTFLDILQTVFNFEWRFIGNTLYIEPIEFFDRLGNVYDLSNECASLDITGAEYWARMKIGYPGEYPSQGDNKIFVDFNTPPSPAQTGLLDIEFRISQARFRTIQSRFLGNGFERVTVLSLRDAKISSQPKVILIDEATNRISLNQSPMTVRNLADLHLNKSPRSDSFKQFSMVFDDLELCDFLQATKDDTYLFKGTEIRVDEIEKDYLESLFIVRGQGGGFQVD